MRKVKPYQSARNAMVSLDNGGRFFNLLTQAKDDKIETAELAKAAGVFAGKQKMVIYLEMALSSLTGEDRETILSKLSKDLLKAYKKYSPKRYVPSEAVKLAEKSQSGIVTGIPKLVDSKTEFSGFVIVPISTGSVTTMVLIPIMDQYDVYELRDNESGKEILIAHARGKNKLPEQMVRCGGVFKELKNSKKKNSSSRLYLETLFYTLLS